MIFSECVDCSEPLALDESGEIIGTWRLLDCDSCGSSNVVEVTRIGGKTHSQEYFEENILPDLEDVERIDHPSGEITIYGNPKKIGVK